MRAHPAGVSLVIEPLRFNLSASLRFVSERRVGNSALTMNVTRATRRFTITARPPSPPPGGDITHERLTMSIR